MTDPNFPQISEAEYLSDYYEGERVSSEQRFFEPFVRRPLNDQMHPQVQSEGSAINNPRINTGKT
jgi:hypothetical protein